MVALQYHQVEVRVNFQQNMDIPFSAKLYGNYVYLDAPERKRFTSTKLDFIITQTQTIKEKLTPGYNDYDQLMRLDEWQASFVDDDEEARA